MGEKFWAASIVMCVYLFGVLIVSGILAVFSPVLAGFSFVALCFVSLKIPKSISNQIDKANKQKSNPGNGETADFGGVVMSFGSSRENDRAYDLSSPTYSGKGCRALLEGVVVESPMAYISERKSKGTVPLPHVIYSKLPVGTNLEEDSMGYWPSYSGISPNARFTYLRWLSRGKCSLDIDIGYVFLYFYGLEFRAVCEGKDKAEILDEVIRLHGIYSSNGSFKNYSEGLITWLVLSLDQISESTKSAISGIVEESGRYSPLRTHGVKFLLRKDTDLSFEDVYDLIPLQSGVQSSVIPEKVGQLFKRYILETIAEKSKDILKSARVEKIEFRYHFASSFRGLDENATAKGVQVVLPSKSQKSLARIWNDGIEEFRPYSRKLGKASEAELHQLMPDSLKGKIEHPLQRRVSQLLTSVQLSPLRVSELYDLFAATGIDVDKKLTLRASKKICNVLQDTGYALEPDARCSGKAYKPEEYVVVYKPSHAGELEISNYQVAHMLFDLGVAVACSDDIIVDRELEVVESFVCEHFCKSPLEGERIGARKLLAKQGHIDGRGVAKKLSERLKAKDLEPIGRLLFATAMADQVLLKAEMEAVKKIFNDLGLSDQYLEVLIEEFKGELGKSQLATIRPGNGEIIKGSSIPQNESDVGPASLSLDMSRIEHLKENTIRVRAILAETFDEEEEVPEPEVEVLSREASTDGFPEDLSAFYGTLVSRDVWEKEDLKKMAIKHGVMLSDAIDRINNWSDESFGDYLIYELEKFEVQRSLIHKEVTSA